MLPANINIGIIEPSDLVYEGLINILLKYRSGLIFYRIDDLDEISIYLPKIKPEIVILNTIIIQNRIKLFRNIKREHSGIRWIGTMHSLINKETSAEFDDIFRIDEKAENICRMIVRMANPVNMNEAGPLQKTLSEREIDVLKCLSKGLSNKEIADNLNISIHTVISHRKNIVQKTGIKSQSGLTIFALSNNIITLDTL
jgi:DNA-binding NarL/FixJ family response regulator